MLALRIAVFLLTLSLGIIASALGRIEVREAPAAGLTAIDHSCHPRGGEVPEWKCGKAPNFEGGGDGIAAGSSGPNEQFIESEKTLTRSTRPLKITYKQMARYTDEARQNGIQGTVTLRVVFLASGPIGAVTVVKGLSHGLTEQAIAAARQIRFEPELRNGVPRTVVRRISYNFNIY